MQKAFLWGEVMPVASSGVLFHLEMSALLLALQGSEEASSPSLCFLSPWGPVEPRCPPHKTENKRGVGDRCISTDSKSLKYVWHGPRDTLDFCVHRLDSLVVFLYDCWNFMNHINAVTELLAASYVPGLTNTLLFLN